MATDPVVQQVRATRKEIERQYPDAESFYRHLEPRQAYRARLTGRAPKRPPRSQTS